MHWSARMAAAPGSDFCTRVVLPKHVQLTSQNRHALSVPCRLCALVNRAVVYCCRQTQVLSCPGLVAWQHSCSERCMHAEPRKMLPKHVQLHAADMLGMLIAAIVVCICNCTCRAFSTDRQHSLLQADASAELPCSGRMAAQLLTEVHACRAQSGAAHACTADTSGPTQSRQAYQQCRAICVCLQPEMQYVYHQTAMLVQADASAELHWSAQVTAGLLLGVVSAQPRVLLPKHVPLTPQNRYTLAVPCRLCALVNRAVVYCCRQTQVLSYLGLVEWQPGCSERCMHAEPRTTRPRAIQMRQAAKQPGAHGLPPYLERWASLGQQHEVYVHLPLLTATCSLDQPMHFQERTG